MKYALWTSLGESNTRRQMAKPRLRLSFSDGEPDLKGTVKLNHFQRYFEASGVGCHSLFNTYRDKFLALLFFFTCALLSTGFFFTPSALTAWGCTSVGTTQFNRPSGVAVDSSGNVYVADTWNHRIQSFDDTCLPTTPSLSKICRTCPSTFSVRQGRTLCKSFSIRSCVRGQVLNWTVSEGCDWLTLTSSSGTSTGERDSIRACVNTAGLAKSDYQCTVTITGDGASNSPQTCVIKLRVR